LGSTEVFPIWEKMMGNWNEERRRDDETETQNLTFGRLICSRFENVFYICMNKISIGLPKVMHVISRLPIIKFWEKHPDDELPLRIWFKKMEQGKWKNLVALKKDFPTADYVGNDRVVFDIKGNHYRVIVLVFFSNQKAFIRFVGTHAQYDKIDAKTV
jgi:mRNA interferase HigB